MGLAKAHASPRASLLGVLAALLVVAQLGARASARTMDEWRDRVVYQVVTDRFATDVCYGYTCDWSGYCGGTWRGTAKMAPYLRDLGVNAVWQSPFTAQGTDMFGGAGFMGYWPGQCGTSPTLRLATWPTSKPCTRTCRPTTSGSCRTLC